MTHEEALYGATIEQKHEEALYWHTHNGATMEQKRESEAFIKEALEKQIPKKPKILKVHDILGYKYGECQCGEHIMDDEKYCSNCGQKLNWESDAK